MTIWIKQEKARGEGVKELIFSSYTGRYKVKTIHKQDTKQKEISHHNWSRKDHCLEIKLVSMKHQSQTVYHYINIVMLYEPTHTSV